FVVEKDRLHGQIQATSTDAAALPTGFVTLLMTDIEASTVLLRKLGDGYGALLHALRGILRAAVSRPTGRESGPRAHAVFAGLEAHPIQRPRSTSAAWPSGRREALSGPGAGTAPQISPAADRGPAAR